jgi:hypothetical protein
MELVSTFGHGIEEHGESTDDRSENLVNAFVDRGVERVAWTHKNRVEVLIEVEMLLVKRNLPICSIWFAEPASRSKPI